MLSKIGAFLLVAAHAIVEYFRRKYIKAGREEVVRENKAELEKREANAKSVDNLSLDELLELRRKRKSDSGNVSNDNKE
jgi:hypothetical protein